MIILFGFCIDDIYFFHLFDSYILLKALVSFMLPLITLLQVHLAFSLFLSTKVLYWFISVLLALNCVTRISFYKSSYYFLLLKSTAFLLGHEGSALYSWSRMPLSRPCLLSLVSAPAGLLLTLDSLLCTNTLVLVLASVPDVGLICIHHWCPAVVSFIADVPATCAVFFLLVVLCFRLGGVRVACVPSELAATFLSLKINILNS